MNSFVNIWKVGNISYIQSVKLQNLLIDMHRSNINSSAFNTLLLVEHPPVYTIGIRTKDYTDEDETRLRKTGAEFYRTNRGGLITFHGPGQLVVYPILNLKNFKLNMRCYVHSLEETIIDLCNNLGIKAQTSPYTGVWVGDNKVCAMGVHGSRYITSHGLALNCCTDLNWYDHIIPCGIKDKGVTSLSLELNKYISIEDVIPLFLNSFSKIFKCSYVQFPSVQIDNLLSIIMDTKFS